MIACRIPGANIAMKGPEGSDIYTLYVRSETHDGVNRFISRWQPTEAELHLLLNGGAVELHILGSTHPPVALVAAE